MRFQLRDYLYLCVSISDFSLYLHTYYFTILGMYDTDLYELVPRIPLSYFVTRHNDLLYEMCNT